MADYEDRITKIAKGEISITPPAPAPSSGGGGSSRKPFSKSGSSWDPTYPGGGNAPKPEPPAPAPKPVPVIRPSSVLAQSSGRTAADVTVVGINEQKGEVLVRNKDGELYWKEGTESQIREAKSALSNGDTGSYNKPYEIPVGVLNASKPSAGTIKYSPVDELYNKWASKIKFNQSTNENEFLGTKEQWTQFNSEKMQADYKPSIVYNYRGQQLSVPTMALSQLSTLSPKDQFNKMASFGIIEPGSRATYNPETKELTFVSAAQLRQIEKTKQANLRQVSALNKLSQYKNKEGYNLSAAIGSGISEETLIAAGFNSDDIKDAKKLSTKTEDIIGVDRFINRYFLERGWEGGATMTPLGDDIATMHKYNTRFTEAVNAGKEKYGKEWFEKDINANFADKVSDLPFVQVTPILGTTMSLISTPVKAIFSNEGYASVDSGDILKTVLGAAGTYFTIKAFKTPNVLLGQKQVMVNKIVPGGQEANVILEPINLSSPYAPRTSIGTPSDAFSYSKSPINFMGHKFNPSGMNLSTSGNVLISSAQPISVPTKIFIPNVIRIATALPLFAPVSSIYAPTSLATASSFSLFNKGEKVELISAVNPNSNININTPNPISNNLTQSLKNSKKITYTSSSEPARTNSITGERSVTEIARESSITNPRVDSFDPTLRQVLPNVNIIPANLISSYTPDLYQFKQLPIKHEIQEPFYPFGGIGGGRGYLPISFTGGRGKYSRKKNVRGVYGETNELSVFLPQGLILGNAFGTADTILGRKDTRVVSRSRKALKKVETYNPLERNYRGHRLPGSNPGVNL